MGLPAIKEYMDSRHGMTEHPLLGLSHKKMNADKLRTCPAIEGEYGYVEAPMWGSESQFTKELFRDNGASLQTRFETVDLPYIYQQGDLGL